MSDQTVRLLLVEHSAGDARHIREMLDDAVQADPTIPAFDLGRATKLSTARKRLAKGNIDVVLLALPLPDAQGLGAFTALRAEGPQVPIVILSDSKGTELAMEAVREGAQDHLVKGQTSGDLLVRSLRYAIERAQAEAALLRARREWEEIFQAIGHPTLILNPQHGIIAANRATGEILGQPQANIIGQRCCDIFHGTADPPDRCPLDNLIDSCESETVEMEMEAFGGTYLVSCTPVLDETGSLEKVIHIATDITELKKAERALRRERDLVSRVMETSPAGIAVMDRSGHITFANTRAEQVLGLTKDEITQRTYNAPEWHIENYDGNPFPDEQLPFRRVMTTGQSVFDVRHAIEWPDGTRVLLSINAAPLVTETGQVDGVVATVEDVTERVRAELERARAESALRESEERFRALVQNSSDITVILESDGTVRYASPALERILGYEPASVIGHNPLDHIHPEDIAAVHVQLTEALEHPGIPVHAEFRLRHMDGSWIYVETLGTNLLTQPGIEGIVVNARDITERRQAEEALRESMQTAADIVEAIPSGLFIYQHEPPDRLILVDGNPEAEHLTGIRIDEWRGREFDEIWPQARTTGVTQAYLDVMRTGETFEAEDLHDADERLEGAFRIRAFTMPASRLGVAFENITERRKAEEELRKREAHRSLVLGSLPMAFYTARPFGDYGGTWVSEQIDQIVGFTAEEFLEDARLWASRLHPEDRERVLHAFERLPDTGTLKTEYRIKTADGRYIWLLDHAVLTRDRDGEPKEIIGTWLDITDRKQAEEALQASERFLQNVFGAIQDGISVLDTNLNVIRTNRWIEQMYTHQLPLPGRKCYDVYQQRQSPCPWCPTLLTIETGEMHTEIVPYPSADDPAGWIELSAFPIKNEQGHVTGVIEYVKDITERAKAEQEKEQLLVQIQEQAQQLQQVMDAVPAGVFLLGSKGRIILANPLGKKHLSILADTLVGGTLTRLGNRPLPAILTSPPHGLWHDIVAEGREFQVIARPIETGPTPAGWVLVIRDVTEQREIERRSQQQERLASLGQLAAGIAHDFNNIMAVITLYAGMSLRTPGVQPKIAERLEVIDQQARRASELIQQIMDFSRRAVLERGPMDLLTFAKEQTKLLQRTLPESIRISLTYGKADYTIKADPTRIQQVLMNLATNARDAMPGGGQLCITLDRVQIDESGPPPIPGMNAGEWISIRVEDTGAGIPEDVLPHIFDPFFTTKEPGKGTGLGLAQVYGIIRQHEGHIDVYTGEDAGTTFVIYLPALSVEQPQTTAGTAHTLPHGKGEIILVVEDDTTTREAIVSSLELLGYHVLETSNGQQALKLFEQHSSEIALVLSDTVMPEMGGRALFRQLSRLERGIKVVLMSGHPFEEAVLEELRAEGLAGWLPKPPDLTRLAEAISQALAVDK